MELLELVATALACPGPDARCRGPPVTSRRAPGARRPRYITGHRQALREGELTSPALRSPAPRGGHDDHLPPGVARGRGRRRRRNARDGGLPPTRPAGAAGLDRKS